MTTYSDAIERHINSLLLGVLVSLTVVVVPGLTKSELQCNDQPKTIENMKLKITYGEVVLTATMYDNPTSRDLISMLPIRVVLDDYASTEKIFYPDRKLTTKGASGGYSPATGDITYYAPWGDVAIFYKNFSYASGLISLGRIDNNGIEQLRRIGKETVTIELISE